MSSLGLFWFVLKIVYLFFCLPLWQCYRDSWFHVKSFWAFVLFNLRIVTEKSFLSKYLFKVFLILILLILLVCWLVTVFRCLFNHIVFVDTFYNFSIQLILLLFDVNSNTLVKRLVYLFRFCVSWIEIVKTYFIVREWSGVWVPCKMPIYLLRKMLLLLKDSITFLWWYYMTRNIGIYFRVLILTSFQYWFGFVWFPMFIFLAFVTYVLLPSFYCKYLIWSCVDLLWNLRQEASRFLSFLHFFLFLLGTSRWIECIFEIFRCSISCCEYNWFFGIILNKRDWFIHKWSIIVFCNW